MDNQDLLRLDGFQTIGQEQTSGGLIVDVQPSLPHTAPCHCTGYRLLRHGRRTVCFKDFPIQRMPVTIRVKRQRWRCEACGAIVLEPLPWLDTDHNMTNRFRNQIAADAIRHTFVDAAMMNGVQETMVRRIFKQFADHELDGYRPTLPRVLGMDEKVIQGRPRFVIGDVEGRTMLDIRASRRGEYLEEYFGRFSGREKVEVITQDMYWGYKEINERYFRKAVIVIDKFHVVRYANMAVEAVRKSVQNMLDDKGRVAMKKNIRLLGARPATLDDDGRRALKLLLKDHPTLELAVTCKEWFYDIYECKTPAEAEKAYLAWEELLPREMEKPFKAILSYMREKRWRRLILNYFEHPYTNAYIEGLNNLIDQINRCGRGYNLETLRAKALLRYGEVHRLSPMWAPEIVAQEGQAYLDIMFPLTDGHGIDLSTFEADLIADRF